ncbi:MAG: thiosulfate sulfurtransferase GlpE [Gammaproteobacteria bacterium]|nr:thiosulfate sulfurtransferase GlpE [Gammaproteobacteria bacterium]
MSEFSRISVATALEQIQQHKAVVVDIRDEQSYASGHIADSFHLTNGSLNQFIQQTEFETPVVVVCYHGNSSQGAAQYLAQQGFETVFSMDGGFEAWRSQLPFVSESHD